MLHNRDISSIIKLIHFQERVEMNQSYSFDGYSCQSSMSLFWVKRLDSE